MRKALILGANGFIGGQLLDILLNDPDYDKVTVIARSEMKKQHPKLRVLLADFNTLMRLEGKFEVDDVFIAVGTTRSQVPDTATYYEIDHDYPLRAAKMALKNGALTVSIVTAVGANPKSGMFYVMAKGKTERDLIALNFMHTHIYRPSMLLGRTNNKRFFETIIATFWPLIDWLFIGNLKKYRGIHGREVARAMVNIAKTSDEKVGIYEWKDMKARQLA